MVNTAVHFEVQPLKEEIKFLEAKVYSLENEIDAAN